MTFFIGLIGFISNDKILPFEQSYLPLVTSHQDKNLGLTKKESFLIILNFSINSISLKDV